LDTSTPHEDSALDITRQEFIDAQREDPELQHMWQQVEQQDESSDGSPHFMDKDGMLLRVRTYPTEDEEVGREPVGSEETCIVVPAKYRNEVLCRGHDVAGHYAVKKTKKMVEDHFFWPGMGRDITQHYKTCKQCLMFNNKGTKKEPMMLVETISVP
jgi:hypothetical protein